MKSLQTEKIGPTNASDDGTMKRSAAMAEMCELLNDCCNHHGIAYRGIWFLLAVLVIISTVGFC